MRFALKVRNFSSTSELLLSSVQWISPLQNVGNADSPFRTSDVTTGVPRKSKFLSHETTINLIKHENDPQRALEIFQRVSEQKGFCHNHSTYAVILHKLAQCKKFGMVERLLHQMRYETCKFYEGIFINLMKHFSRSSMPERVLDMFNAIESIVREKPSLTAISTCLNLLVENHQIDLARAFLLDVQKNLHLKPNTCIFNILVKYHCKKGDIESAKEVVKEMKLSTISYPNLITYSTLMAGLCGCGRLDEAIIVFEEMVSKDHIVPDALTYNVLINGFCRAGKADKAKNIIAFMKKNGCIPNIYNYSCLMNGFCKEGKLEEAKEEMKALGLRADTVTFNIILGGLCRECRFDEALNMIERLPYDGVYLDKTSYRIVLNSLCKKGELEKATELVGLMLVRGFLPHFATSNEILLSLCESGKAANAITMLFGLLTLGFKPEPNTWTLLVDMVCRERKLLTAFELLDTLVMPALPS
ncbi:OLC1v1017264C1 [Oldenlandia corymbosa var. corymbosa]|uniref:OLC1v1017264C1 n=1 Tax=Oldenlandia corymbosa var. corymbosa TaxID=529605 RepID=A0AAV1E924_OLDCO|nr:OLC1v1017264C1 [Oldenlandia corymbosa var. corymbosa]